MASCPASVKLLVDACIDGDAYGGMQTFKAVLRRKVRSGEELVAHDMLDAAFSQALVETKCSEVAPGLSEEFFNLLTCFGHKGDTFCLERMRAIADKFENVEKNDTTVALCHSHLQFLCSAKRWWKTKRDEASVSAVGREEFEKEAGNLIAFIHEALCFAYLRLAHCAANDADCGNDAVCEAFAAAYNTSHLCLSKSELIRHVACKVQDKLADAEKRFLIAHTIYSVLSGASELQKTHRGLALATAKSLLQEEGMDENCTALSSFLHDVLIILEAASRQKDTTPENHSVCNVIKELCSSYSLALGPVGELNWIALARLF